MVCAMSQSSNLHRTSQMRVLAHPTRLRLLALLRELGPQTAAHLAKHVDEAAGTLSYHLAKLAEEGFIEPAPEVGTDARQRWWRASNEKTSWTNAEFSSDPEKLSAQKDMYRFVFQYYSQQFDTYLDQTVTLTDDWVNSGFATDRHFHLTSHQLQELNTEIQALEQRWLEISALNKGNDDAAAVFFLAQGYRQP